MDFILTKNKKNDTLDPLSVIIKLFIYGYKPIGTKISISNNKIVIQDIGIFQSSVRYISRDSKNDINIIFFPIIFACRHYLSSDNKKKFISLFNKLLDSFDKMKETYHGNEIIYNIEQLKNIITSFVENPDYDPNIILPNYDSPSGLIKQNIYNHLNSIWTTQRLNVILSHFDEITYSTSIELTNNLINSLNTYMNCIDIITCNLINNV